MTPDLYWEESLRFRAKAEAVTNDPELRASYEAAAEAYARLAGYVFHKLEDKLQKAS